MLTIYFLSVVISVVAANPILQRIPMQIPGQTYPMTTCPSCPTQACPSQTCPARGPCQTCQNPYRSVFNPQPIAQPSSSCPCNKIVQNSILDPVNQEALSQLILRRILSQPQANQIPIKTCEQCEAQKVPNIINNYIIIPSEYFKTNESTTDKDESVKQRRKGKRRRKQSRQRDKQANSTCHCEDNDELKNNKTFVGEYVPTCICEKEKSSSIGETKVQHDHVDSSSIPKTEIVYNNDPTNLKVPINDQQAHSEINPVNDTKPRKRNREHTKNLEEAIIRDFCRKNPSIPKEIARSLLDNLKRKVESYGNSQYNPYPLLPFGYSPYNPQMFYPGYDMFKNMHSERVQSSRGSKRRKQQRSGRRNNKSNESIRESKNSDMKCEKIIEMNPSVINIEKETVTTERITTTTENKFKGKIINDSETQMETPDDLLNQLDQMKAKFAKLNEIETTTVGYKRIDSYPELGQEDKVPTVYDNGVDDYYPDFRGDNVAFYASEEEFENKESRYVDAKKSSNVNKCESTTERPLSVSTESYDSYEESKDDPEIKFRTPPHLEIPDFETKPINLYSQNDRFVADDSKSDAKADSRIPEIDMKPAKVFTKDKSGRTNIETVFGHSRVVKYGQDADAAGSESVITYYLPEEAMTEDRIQLPDGETVVVVAKSIRDLDDWE